MHIHCTYYVVAEVGLNFSSIHNHNCSILQGNLHALTYGPTGYESINIDHYKNCHTAIHSVIVILLYINYCATFVYNNYINIIVFQFQKFIQFLFTICSTKVHSVVQL